MQNVKNNLLVLSGKGGVGKSSVAVNLAVWLSMQGKNVGLLDIDIHGPSIGKLLNLDGKKLTGTEDKIIPISYNENLKVLSVGFLLETESKALIWRGPMKHNVIKQFITETDWGSLDYLIVDCPPGTGDEPLSAVQLLTSPQEQDRTIPKSQNTNNGAIVVTTPQQLSIVDVKKCITFCRQLNLPVLGVVENMSGFVCPKCGEKTDILSSGGGENMAIEMKMPFLGRIPIDPALVQSCDAGKPYVLHHQNDTTAEAFEKIFTQILKPNNSLDKHIKITNQKGENKMRIALPITDDKLSAHFGHCQQFAVVDIDNETKKITKTDMLTPPAHEPGVLPKWLSEMNVSLIIAGGMGQRAQQLFTKNNIEVLVGAPDDTPENIVTQYLTGQLQSGQNICDH